jgi:hypothetical protein
LFAALPRFGDTPSASAPVMPAPEPSAQETAIVLNEDERGLLTGDPLGDLDVVGRIAIMRWMAANPTYEFITRDYCGCHDIPVTNCPEYDERRARELSDYSYSDVLDYNGDKRKDFAVMLGEKAKKGRKCCSSSTHLSPTRSRSPRSVSPACRSTTASQALSRDYRSRTTDTTSSRRVGRMN